MTELKINFNEEHRVLHQSCWISRPAQISLSGVMHVPGDKSISHRALLFGAIGEGQTLVRGFLPSEDCLATMRILSMLGVRINQTEQTMVSIEGVGLRGFAPPAAALNCGNSGTTMRLLMGLLAAQSFDSVLIGDESLQKRPMARVSQPLNQMGAQITLKGGCAPIEIKKNAHLLGMTYTLPVASAQLKSALLLSGLYCLSPVVIQEPVVTRDHTERLFTLFGAPLLTTTPGQYTLVPGARLYGTEVDVPGDLSSAAFFIVAATLIESSDLWIHGVGVNPTRMGVIHILKAMGANIEIENMRVVSGEPVADLHVRHAELRGITIDEAWVSLAIDEFPILFIAAAKARGTTRMSNLSELRYKETDRIQGMIAGLTALGVRAFATADSVVIEGGEIQGGEVSSGGDHRLAMAFMIAGCVARAPLTVLNCESVSTSFPSFMSIATQFRLPFEVSHV